MNSLAAQTWLIVRNDLRLLWRGWTAGKLQRFSSVAFLVFLFVILHVVAFLLFFALRRDPSLTAMTIFWALFGFVMLGAAMNEAIAVLFQRADFDLLLASPVSPRAILLARGLTMIAAAAASVALFVIPALNAAIVFRSPWFVCGYVTWLVLASAVASAGTWFTLLLVHWLGAQRARTWSQVIAGVLGASLYLLFQGQNLLPRQVRAAAVAKLEGVINHPVLTLPAQASRGEWLPLLILVAVAVLLAVVTTRLLSRLFVTGVQEAGGVKPAPRQPGRFVFAEGLLRATFWKDTRIIVRDPLLLSKVLPQALYLIPLIFALGQIRGGSLLDGLAPYAVLLSLVMAPTLTAIATAGDEGWDLIRMSGASTRRLRWAKIAAGMMVPVGLCAIIALVLAVLGRPGVALFTLFVAIVGTTAMCWLEVLTIKPTPRADLLQAAGRGRRGFNPLRFVIGAFIFSGSVGGAGMAAHDKWLWAAVGAALAALVAGACFLLPTSDPEFA